MMRLTIFCLLALVLGGCASTPQEKLAADREDLASDVRDELRVGREMAAKLYGHFGKFDAEPELPVYVGTVGTSLAQSAGRPELRYYFGILDTEEVNAFATPGGFVFITHGLLQQLHSESELAGVLAHEIAHINERHMYLGIRPKHEVTAEESVARIMSRGRADLGKSLSLMADKGLQMLLEGGLGKEKEVEADQEALTLISWTGYDPQAYVGLLRRLEQNSKTLKFGKVAQPFAERIAALDKFAAANGISNRKTADTAVLQKRFARAWRSLAQE